MRKRSVALTPSSRSLPSKANQALVELLGGIAQRKKAMLAQIWPDFFSGAQFSRDQEALNQSSAR
jgi:hypothetical protein